MVLSGRWGFFKTALLRKVHIILRLKRGIAVDTIEMWKQKLLGNFMALKPPSSKKFTYENWLKMGENLHLCLYLYVYLYVISMLCPQRAHRSLGRMLCIIQDRTSAQREGHNHPWRAQRMENVKTRAHWESRRRVSGRGDIRDFSS